MDSSAKLLIKQRIVTTTSTPGWSDIRKLAEQTVKQLERKAIDEEDDVKGTALRRDARVASKFIKDFFDRIDAARQVTDEPTDDTWLEVCM